MTSQAVSPNTTSDNSGQDGTTSSMLGPFIYDTSSLENRLIQRAMAATTTTTAAAKDKSSNDTNVKDFEKSGEATAKL
ncbi:hypothetical protein CEP54_001997 [Fusarium duplospermum]|uniref:Uncharacterized protein n=1 Tax=Fusarium duplospermum TaxID=1325734 RepID=A0A428QXJ0_9HYPO|nr:hypothetical protein CEP54_001997 [Fusarium duplospermum]